MIVKLSILVISMFLIGYLLGRVEERVKNESTVSKKLDISRYLNNRDTSIQVEQRKKCKRSHDMVSNMDCGSVRDNSD